MPNKRMLHGECFEKYEERIPKLHSQPSQYRRAGQPKTNLQPANNGTIQKYGPKTVNPFEQYHYPPQIEYYLLARNRAHFGKAAGTPFTVPPLSTSIKWTADTPEAEMILEGKYNASSLDDITQMLLQFCKQVSIPDAVSNVITLQEFEGKL